MRRKSLLSVLFMGWLLCVSTACSLLPGTSIALTAFSRDGVEYDYTIWAPDGHWLAAPVESGTQDQVRLYSPAGQVLGTWHSDCGENSVWDTISWLPDGRLSCVYSNEPPTLWIARLNQRGQDISHETIPLPTQPGTQVMSMKWSPHHDWLAMLAEAEPGSLNILLSVSDLHGHLLFPPLSADDGTLAWSPDGNTLALVRQQEISLLTFRQTGTGDLEITAERQLPVQTPLDQTIAWSPSGHWLVCRHETYEGEDYLFLLATDGSGKQVQLTSSSSDGQVFDPAWSPNGKLLIVTSVGSWSLLSLDMVAFFQQKKLRP